MTSLRTAGDPVDILEYESTNCAPTPASYVLESLSFIWHHPMKAYGGGEVWLHTFICRMIRRIGNLLFLIRVVPFSNLGWVNSYPD
jgi:hypothetical protein